MTGVTTVRASRMLQDVRSLASFSLAQNRKLLLDNFIL